MSDDKGRRRLSSAFELGDTPLERPPRPGPVLLELKIETQCHEGPKRPRFAATVINHLLLALSSEGKMTAYQIKQTLEGLTKYWTKVDRKDAELPMIEWEPETDDIFVCSSCNAMMFIQFMDEETRPQYCPRCRGTNTLVPAEPDAELCRPVLRLIPGGVRGDRGGTDG
jgi:hypothetical protein